jgi:DNA damage-inducible protein 1
VVQDDIILVTRLGGGQAQAVRGGDHIEAARQRLIADPQMLRTLELQNPQVAQAARDPVMFRRLMEQIELQRRQSLQVDNDLLNADPFDVEAQKKIEEAIRKENISRNMEV